MGIVPGVVNFSKKRWLVLVALVLVATVCLSIFLFSGRSVDPQRVEKRLAGYRQEMATQPTDKLAKKIMDCAIILNRPELVFELLKESLYPAIGVAGVEEEFWRGCHWYLRNGPGMEEFMWLFQEDRGLERDRRFNDTLAEFFRTLAGADIVKCGNVIFANWQLDVDARHQYLSALTHFWLLPNLPLAANARFFGLELFNASSLRYVDVPEFKGLAPWLELCLSSWAKESPPDLLKAIAALEDTPDPAHLRPLLWAIVALKDLKPGWVHPEELDLVVELAAISPYLKEKEAVYLYELRDPASAKQAMALLKSCGALLNREEVAVLLLRAGGYDESQLGQEIIDPRQYSPAPQEVLALLEESAPHLGSIYPRVAAILGAPGNSAFSLEKIITIPEGSGFSLSSSEPVALYRDDSGYQLLNLLTMEEKKLEDADYYWSPQGNFFIQLLCGSKTLALKVFSPAGVELQKYYLPLIPNCYYEWDWNTPWELALRGAVSAAVDFRAKTLVEITDSPSALNVPGTDLHYFSTEDGTAPLFNWDGEEKGLIVFGGEAERCHCPGAVFYQENNMLFMTREKISRNIRNNTSGLVKVAVLDGVQNYYCFIYDDISQEKVVTLVSPEGEIIREYNAWHPYNELESLVLQSEGSTQRLLKDNPIDPACLLLADGKELPLYSNGANLAEAIRIGEDYFFLLQFDDDHGDYLFLWYKLKTP